MLQFFKNPNIDFMKFGRATVIGSVAVIVVSLAVFGVRLATNPGSVLAVDLTGGTSAVYAAEGGKFEVGAVRKALESIDNAMVIQQRGDDLFVKTGIITDSGTVVEFNVKAGADKFNRELAKRSLAAFDVNNTIALENVATAVGEDGVTNSVGKLTVKVSETSASSKGRGLKERGVAVADEIARAVKERNRSLVLEVADVKETLGVESRIEDALNNDKSLGGVKFTCKSRETVGSIVGADLRSSGSKAVLLSLVAILIYVGVRFRFGFGLGGIAALAHDALISLGLFSLCGRQVSLIVITALLTIIGYSINDTVVVFDRIREQLQRDRRSSFRDLCNTALNSCLSRTVITSLTTFFAVAALFVFGDGSIYDFALTMLIGVVAGTYSSVFIATPVMYWWYRGKRPDLDDDEEKKEVR
jgi:preprotein translocase SecF subunit